jgi:hypothetical protein
MKLRLSPSIYRFSPNRTVYIVVSWAITVSAQLVFAAPPAFAAPSRALTASTTSPKAARKCKLSFEGARHFYKFNAEAETRVIWRNIDNRTGFEAWQIDGRERGELSYNTYFSDALGGQTIENYIWGRRAHGLTAHVADLFGSAVFSNSPSAFQSLTGVRLHPLDPKLIPAEYKTLRRWRELTGDIYLRSTWNKLDQSMQERKIPAFDLILVRPVGPLYLQTGQIYSNSDAYFGVSLSVVERAWQRLSSRQGKMLIQITSSIEISQSFQKWLKRLEAAGIRARLIEPKISFWENYPTLELIKTQENSTLLH